MPTPNPELPQNPNPSLSEVTAAYADILEHNSQHTGYGPMFRGFLRGLIENPQLVDVDNPSAPITRSSEDLHKEIEEKMEEQVVEGDMHAELQIIFHDDTFMRAGIKIAPFGTLGVNGEGKAVTSTELVPMIENTSLFTEFLGRLSPEDAQDVAAKTFLSDVISNLSKKTGLCFDKRKHEGLSDEEKTAMAEAGEDALRTFVAIDTEYARLGMDGTSMRARVEGISKDLSDFLNSNQGGVIPKELSDEYRQYTENGTKMRVYEGMAMRVHYWGRNLLPEYLVAQDGQYLTPPKDQQFGPADWQEDGGQYRWQEAFSFLGRLEQNERTMPFAHEVRQGLTTSLDASLAEIDDPKKDVYWKDQRADLENVREALTGRKFNEEQLANYIKKPDYFS